MKKMILSFGLLLATSLLLLKAYTVCIGVNFILLRYKDHGFDLLSALVALFLVNNGEILLFKSLKKLRKRSTIDHSTTSYSPKNFN